MCTSITLMTTNHINTLSRTMDFAFVLNQELLFIPRAYPLLSEIDATERPTNYAVMGMGRNIDTYVFADGLNEAGLACATLYFPGYAHYNEELIAGKTNLAPHEVAGWLLTNFSNIDEVKTAAAELNIINRPFKLMNIVTPFHWIITDKTGATIVIEPMKDGLVIHDNPHGVMTNSPDFNWHLTNVRNYVSVKPNNNKSIELNGITFEPFGNGSGAVGLPGDYLPPSRFLRALFGKETINKIENEDECVNAAFHILASVDIPKGSVRTDQGVDYTQYTASMVCNTGTYYFKTYDNNQITRFCLFNEDFEAKEPKTWNVLLPQQYKQLN
ncbi:linear amide C-N hydrolase [Acetobacterium woodii]|uniref:Choloylglycine hydrolase YxeI1 n=1 Tax=Acetobacterium woodii (strain ATCC 29683 / DSM 1030 / JCM 2381 / KCTC 1655 / WB1) TaxID=931626 RepID=H6LJH6_ACEWD|nr:choloylglycine hydrolase family protein [Acetobacterium woodii]AFA49904.1 choloylglycine hydrolase YxeI1 [Acetobacterium woodii DSM 1030]